MHGYRFAILALTLFWIGGCRSASPDLTPEAPLGATRSQPSLPELPRLAGNDDALAADASETPAEAGLEAPGADPAAAELQQEALDLCQSAEALLAAGETEEAVAALDRAYELMLALPSDPEGEFLQARDDIRLMVSDLISRAYREGQSLATTTLDWDLDFPVVDNEHVQREIRSFTGVERDAFLEGYRRSGRYRPMILERLEQAGLPSQLSWLPLVESWFKVRALSRASALGMWQFISSTGLRYGLTRDNWMDERFNPEKSTDAAIGYLTDLHGLFGDWPKALAGYNCGEGRVQRLQRRSEDQFLDFWDLYAMLPGETRRYVPRLFAAIHIIENPERHGMTLPTPDSPIESVGVEIDRSVPLAELDAALGLEPGLLAELNPELRHKATPKRPFELRVPAGHHETLLAKLDSVPEYTRPVPQNVTHRVRSGETLSVIASRYGTSVSAIMSSNNLRSAHRISIGQRLQVPSRFASGDAPVSPGRFDASAGTHSVRRGETLGSIARRYGIGVADLKRRNRLDSNLIHPGQELLVATPATASTAGGPDASARARRYRVTGGDTLGAIADAHGIGLSALLSANGLGPRSTIYPGQLLTIPN